MAGFGSLYPDEDPAMMPETFVNPLVKHAITGLATLPRRAIEGAAQYQPGSGEIPDAAIAPAVETAMNMVGGGLPWAKSGTVGVSGGALKQPSELAAPYHGLLEQPASEAYNALHGAPNEAVQAATAGEAARDVGGGVAGPSGGGEGLQQARAQAERRAAGRPVLEGLPTKEQIVDGELFVPGPVASAHDVADRYMADKDFGSYHRHPDKHHPIDPEHATAIAKAFDEMPHTPNDPATKASYDALIRETLGQYQAIKESGLKITPTGAADYPYLGNPRAVAKDVADNNHMAFFKTNEGFGSDGLPPDPSHPMMQPSGEKIGDHEMLNNDIFRVVHDYFGHVKNGNGFRAAGEDNAWRAHAAMYSDIARPAMTTETRGQNSWVNYGPHGEANRTASGADTVYADQKVGLMPEWTMRDRGSPEPIIAYHGTPYSFDRFDPNHIGAGEGNQAYGHGLYFAGHSPVSEWYRHQLSARRDPLLEKYGLDSEQGAHVGMELAAHGGDPRPVIEGHMKNIDALKAEGRTDKGTRNMIKASENKIKFLSDPERNSGHMYQVAIDHPPEHFLDWDAKQISGQSPEVRKRLETMGYPSRDNLSGSDIYKFAALSPKERAGALQVHLSGKDWETPTAALREAGIPGIKYLDQGSRGKDTGTHNYVTFDAPRILKKYAVPGAIGAGGFGSLMPRDEQ